MVFVLLFEVGRFVCLGRVVCPSGVASLLGKRAGARQFSVLPQRRAGRNFAINGNEVGVVFGLLGKGAGGVTLSALRGSLRA